MNISLSEYKIANEIFYRLLKKSELKEKEAKELFLAYINNSNVRSALDGICEVSKIKIIAISDTLYLIPNNDNDIIGFDYRKESLLGKDLKDSYLGYLIMTIIFSEFTNGVAPASYIQVVHILDLVQESLERSIARDNIEEIEKRCEFNIIMIKNYWESKRKWDESSKKGIETISADYQIGFVRRVITFLKNEGLILYITDEDKIKPTKRFMDLMNNYFLDEDRKILIEELVLRKGEKI
ncbi:DUF6063 family protein [Asaccharospora irregularis]|uniref:Uncharacterized protein n=1 Tax=Asaccharospora irregularis DSM 2635 TaxID=1121321 RepID=A0A1M5KXD8_9FIRM|nr:DUF6063 family protein [Asaccharospora irregularis]SHG57522.1 hypothetical protein SAMN04488530_103157 [Asaccharospora irregularis DSM 2635]